jgi:hypothetical protein
MQSRGACVAEQASDAGHVKAWIQAARPRQDAGLRATEGGGSVAAGGKQGEGGVERSVAGELRVTRCVENLKGVADGQQGTGGGGRDVAGGRQGTGGGERGAAGARRAIADGAMGEAGRLRGKAAGVLAMTIGLLHAGIEQQQGRAVRQVMTRGVLAPKPQAFRPPASATAE